MPEDGADTLQSKSGSKESRKRSAADAFHRPARTIDRVAGRLYWSRS